MNSEPKSELINDDSVINESDNLIHEVDGKDDTSSTDIGSPVSGPTDTMRVDDKAAQFIMTDFPELDRFDFLDYGAFSKFRQISTDRRAQYDAYDEMTRDIIISSALSMYAEDASQYDTLGKTIWVESKDVELASYLNDLLDTLGIAKKLRSMYYSLAEYGDIYIRLFKKPKDASSVSENKNRLNEDADILVEGLVDPTIDYEDFVEIVDTPEDVFDLVKNGKTCQFAVTNHEAGILKEDRIELYPPDQFVHICIENTHIRDREIFEFKTRDKGTSVDRLHRYKVRRGKSMLYDIYATQKEVQLIESAILLSRISKSSMTRLVSIEVGDMPKTEVQKVMRRVKSKLESKLSINRFNDNSGQIRSYNSPSGFDNIVVNTTRNGKGAINAQTIGGDFDPKSLIDMDYFNAKRFGGLRIPKAFLGYDDALGSNAGGSLTKLDARYGRTVKMLQSCVVSGITDLLNLYLLHRSMSEKINEFTVRVVSPTTVEDIDRDELLMNRLNVINTFMGLAENARLPYANELVTHLLIKYSGDPDINKIILDHVDDPPSDDDDDKFGGR